MSASGGGRGGECTRGDWWGQRWWGARSHILTSWTMCRGTDWEWGQVIGGDLWIAYLETLTWKGQIGQSEKSHKNTTGLIQLLQPSFESNNENWPNWLIALNLQLVKSWLDVGSMSLNILKLFSHQFFERRQRRVLTCYQSLCSRLTIVQ